MGKPLTVTVWEMNLLLRNWRRVFVALDRIWVEKVAVRMRRNTCRHTERCTQGAHTTQSATHIKLNTHKAQKPQQPVLQPSPNLNLIPPGTSIRAEEIRWDTRDRQGFTNKVSILRLRDTTLAFRSESVSCHWNATYYHSAVKSSSIKATAGRSNACDVCSGTIWESQNSCVDKLEVAQFFW